MEVVKIDSALGKIEHIFNTLFIGYKLVNLTEKDRIYAASYMLDTEISDKKTFELLLRCLSMKYFKIGKIRIGKKQLLIQIAQTHTIPAWEM